MKWPPPDLLLSARRRERHRRAQTSCLREQADSAKKPGQLDLVLRAGTVWPVGTMYWAKPAWSQAMAKDACGSIRGPGPSKQHDEPRDLEGEQRAARGLLHWGDAEVQHDEADGEEVGGSRHGDEAEVAEHRAS
jgi:hypothetical protein